MASFAAKIRGIDWRGAALALTETYRAAKRPAYARVVLVALALAVALAMDAAAQALPTVTAVTVQPAPGRRAADYAGLVQQAAGQPLEAAAVAATLRALYATGEFADVEAETYPTESAGQVRLEFATRPNYFLSLIQVLGAPDPPADTELEDATGLTLGQVFNAASLAKAEDSLRTQLRGYGYYQAQVSASQQLDPLTAQAEIRFAVVPGPLTRTGAVTVTGWNALAQPALLRATGLRTGDALTRDRLQAANAALRALCARQSRLTATVTLQPPVYHAATNRLDLHFVIVPGPVVTVTAEGFPISSGDLRAQVPIYQENAADLALVEEGRGNLVNYLQNRGYFEAQVSYQRTQPSPDLLHVVYNIDPGPKETLNAILFRGNQLFDADDLSDRIAIRTASRLPALIPGARGLFSDALAQGDADSIAQLYRDNGYEQVAVRPIVDHAYQGKPGQIAVTFDIHEGAQTLVASVHIAGADAAHVAALQQLLQTTPGQAFAPARVASDRNAILSYYFNQGYQQANCTVATTTAANAGQMDVVFTVTEGELETIHDVYIAGTHFVHRNVVAHALQLAPGAPLSQLALLQSQRALYDSGLFTSADVIVRNPDGAEPAKDVVVSVNEARRYSFSEGVGLQIQGGTGGEADLRDVLGTTGYSPLLSFDATRTAVTGRPQTLSFRSIYGTLQKRALLGYDFPDFLNRSSLQAGLNAFYDDTFDVRTYRAISEQAGVELQQSLGTGVGLTYDLDFRRVRVLDPLVAPQEIPILSQPVEVGEYTTTWRRDRRDDPIETHSGTFNSADVAIARSFGAGFANFARFDYQNRWYHSLGGGVVVARSTAIGVEAPFGQRSAITITNPITGVATTTNQYVVPLPERYLSGGADSLRGFAINQAGPRDPITAFPVGGEAQLINNLELRFPVIGNNIGGVAFYDVGNVYSTPRQMLLSLGRLHPGGPNNDFTSHTVGLGLRYRTPVGPVRLDTGYLLNAPTFAYFSTGTPAAQLFQRLPAFHFFFSIGQTF